MPPADWVAPFARFALSLQGAGPGVPTRILETLRPWFLQLAVNAAPKWLPTLAQGFGCQVPRYHAGHAVGPCPAPAIAACDVCQQPCCLAHARIDSLGDAICYSCVVEAVQRRVAASGAPGGAPPPGKAPPTEQMITAARRVLGLSPDLSHAVPWEDVSRAHRKLSAEWHPDRHAGSGYAAAEAKFKEIQGAFEVLKKDHARRKEAA